MPKGKHLTLDDRQSIQIGLHEGLPFKEIALNIGKDPSTVSKEVRGHRIISRTNAFNPCISAHNCKHYGDICKPCYLKYGKVLLTVYFRNCELMLA